MAAALLGKCIGLLALVLLLYTSCYAFRVREHGAQTVSPTSVEQPQRATCPSIFGRCTEKTSTTTSTASRKWHETAIPRGASSRKPPVEVTFFNDDDAGAEGARSKHGRTGYSSDRLTTPVPKSKSPGTKSLEVDDDEDEEEAIVEVEDESAEEAREAFDEQVVDNSEIVESDEDDDYDEDKGKKFEKNYLHGKRSIEDNDDNDEVEEDSEEDTRKTFDQYKFSSKKEDTRGKATKIGKGSKSRKDDDEDEDDEASEEPRYKTTPEEDTTRMKRTSPTTRNKAKQLDDEATIASEERDERDTDEKDDDDEEEEDSDQKVVPTPPPRKLEKVRHADKDKVKPVESSPSAPTSKEPRVETRIPIETEKHDVPVKKVVEATKTPAESPKKSINGTGKPADSTKKIESKVTKPVSETPKSKPTSKRVGEKQVPLKQEAAAVPAKTKDQVKQVEKAKVNVKATSAKTSEALRSDAKESKQKTKSGAKAPITLAELNDAILHVPTFVPNFTDVENLECQQHGKIFLRQLRGYKLWALQMLDATAKIPSGLLRGNINQYGDFDQCLGVMAHVKVDDKTVKVQGKYCLANIDLYPTRPDMKLPVNLMQARGVIRGTFRDPDHFIPRFTTANWALCLPAACSAKDAENVLEHALSEYNATAGIRFTVNVDPVMCYVKPKARSFSKETIAVLYFFAMVLCLVAVATVRDYFVVTEGEGNYSERIIMSFSLRRTVKSLFKKGTGPADITCIHGIRTFTTIAIYITHQIVPLSMLPFSNRGYLTEVANYPISLIMRVLLVYTDAFLLINGVLTAYNMAHELETRGEIRWFYRFLSKYIRLTPSLLVLVFWYAFIMEHLGTGPRWNNVVLTNAELCKSNAWSNLLYIQNIFPFEEMCATHTHQLALDMQLSLVAPALVFFLQCKPIIGILLMSFFMLLSATLRYVAVTSNHLSLIIFHGILTRQLYKSADLTYTIPTHRITPYFFGVGLGVLLNYTGRNVKIHKVLVILGWLVTATLGAWSIFAPWRLTRRDYVYDPEEITYYMVVTPVVSSLALCWSIFACFTNNGGVINRFLSSYWFLFFSRISYAVYLTQFAVFFYNIGTARYPAEFQLHRAINLFDAAVVVLVSIVMTLFFDLPMQDIESVLMESTDGLSGKISEEEKPTANDKDKGKQVTKEEEGEEKVLEKGDTALTGLHWQKNVVEGDVKSAEEIVDEEESVNVPLLKKSTGIRKSFVGHDEDEAISTWDWVQGNDKRLSQDDFEYVEKGRRSRNSERYYPSDSEEEALELSRIQQEREEILMRSRRSVSRSLDKKRLPRRESEDEYRRRRDEEEMEMEEDDARRYRRSESRGRSATKEADDYRTWEYIGKERSSSRGPDTKRMMGKSEEHDPAPKQTRLLLSRSLEARKRVSSESEEEPSTVQQEKVEKKHVPVEPRISDEEDWESELRIRRKQFMEKLTTQERESLGEEVDLSSLKRRSSAEGRIALLKDPSGEDNMDSWTVSVGPRIAQLGSSQEPSEPEEDNVYIRRREYREQAPPPREETHREEEMTWDSSRRHSDTSGSQRTSIDDEDDVTSFNFVLTRESKRISLQDLSKLSQAETDLGDLGWNGEKNKSTEALPKTTSLGLFKRESIVKSQASEEDPEYLLPERPKLVQQEREHPFKKAWQMQKSRSEEDGSSAYVIKENKEMRDQQIEFKSKVEESVPIKRELSEE